MKCREKLLSFPRLVAGKVHKKSMLDKFKTERLSNKVIEVYFGTGKADRLQGKVVESADGVLVLESNGGKDYVNLDKVLAAWEV